ncbi:hypothetical protein Tco_0587684 [Tanacetum coccineum]
MDAPLSSDHVFDFFAAEPVPRLAEAPDNLNGWIEWDVPLGGEIDEPMVDPGFDEEEMDGDDDDVWDEDDEWLLDSPYLLVLITRTSQSRQHGFTFITVNTKEYHSECSGNYHEDNA